MTQIKSLAGGTVQIVRQLDERLWREFVDGHPSSNVFHTPEMFQVFERAKKHRPTLWAAVEDGSVLALLLPVQVAVIERLPWLTSRAVAYGSVLHAPGPKGEEALALLLRAYKQEHEGAPLFTELRNLSDASDLQPTLDDNGFVYEDHLNYLIDLDRPPEAILQSLGTHTRKLIRRGLRSGVVTVEEVKERGGVAACYDLLRLTYQLAGIPLADRSLFDAAFDILHPKGMARFALAYVRGVPAAVSVELLYKNIVYGWYGGVDRSYSACYPSEMLMWNILEWGATKGYHVYDFGGAGKPNEKYGVRDFKAKFGGTLVCYGRNTCVHSPLRFRLSNWGYHSYQALQRVWLRK